MEPRSASSHSLPVTMMLSALVRLVCWLALLHVSSASYLPLDASPLTFKYYTTSSCATAGTGNVAEVLDFAIQYPPFDGQCHQCFSLLCSDGPSHYQRTATALQPCLHSIDVDH